jgi:hypothetical protein
MPLNLASPGIVVREVDLTSGRIDPTSDSVGVIASPFEKGAVNEPVQVVNEEELRLAFGEPAVTDKHYENWMVASSYLAYGGSLQVVRAGGTNLKNAFVGSASSIKIDSLTDYNTKGYDETTITGVTFAARNPGSWGNGLKVAVIDAKADQEIGIGGTVLADPITAIGVGVTQAIPAGTVVAGAGSTSILDGYLKGIITGITTATGLIEVKVLDHISAAGTRTEVDYTPQGVYKFNTSEDITVQGVGATTVSTTKDWFDQQEFTLTSETNLKRKWSTVAPRPGTSDYAAARGARFDEVHIVVIDAEGKVTGNEGTMLEKHIALSKATDAVYSVGSSSYWRAYLANASDNIFGGIEPAGTVASGFTSGWSVATDNGWDQAAEGVYFALAGNTTYTFAGGTNYDGTSDINAAGAYKSSLADLSAAYELFKNQEKYDVDFLLMGSANYLKEEAQALASKLVEVAEYRKDAIAFISPYRGAFINDTVAGEDVILNSEADSTENVLSFYSSVPSSSFAVLDSGYKYMYDRFNRVFRYVPLNGDLAGLCARNDANNFPWFSPAGTARGAILNAVKLAYNPSKEQRDSLYSNRINPVIFSPGGGIVLFGDKTALNRASAFDRINVRRLFVFLEKAIESAAKDQLFEFNDDITRSNFVNIVEPFLRDVQAKRGIYEYKVVCDETNNTAAIIDANEFVADIFIKPARSINYIGLTFVATSTGVSFEEIVGNV